MLIVSLTLGTVVAGCRAKQALRAELGAGLTGAAQTVASAFEDLPNSDHPMRDLRQLVKTFDGNRPCPCDAARRGRPHRLRLANADDGVERAALV